MMTDTTASRSTLPRILLATADADTQAFVRQLLEPDYEVVVVSDGQAALDEFHRAPDLVLTDVVMPRLDGLQLVKTLKSQPHTAHIPVVLLPARDSDETHVHDETGADDQLGKPFLPGELRARVRAQLALTRARSQADEVLRNMVMQAPYAVCVLRGPEFAVEIANEAQCRMWGRPMAELANRPIFEAIPEASGQGFEALLTQVLTTGQALTISETLARLPTPDAPPRIGYFNCTYQPLRNLQGSIDRVMAVANDVTETVLARQTVQEQANRLQTLFEQAPVGVVIVGAGPDLILEMGNPYYCNIVGRTADQLLGKPLMDAIPELAGQGFEDHVRDVISTGNAWTSHETPVRLLRNGHLETLYVDLVFQPRTEAGAVTGVVGIITDISPAVLARQQVEASEQLLSAMIRRTPLGVAVLRQPDSVIEQANPVICGFWGRSPDEVMGKPLFAALPEAAGQGFEELLTGVYETGMTYTGREMPATLLHDGKLTTIYFDFVYEPLPGIDGRIDRIMIVATDKTAARQSRMLLEESEARYRTLSVELEQRVKLRTQDLERSNLDLMQFASVASHDLKEPLRKVQTFATRLQGMLAGRLDDEEADMFRRLVNATSRMSTLIGDVLRLSILSDRTADVEPVNLNAVIGQIREDLELLIQDRQAVLTSDTLPVLVAMPGQMHQLFQNLISNALKFNTSPVPTIHVGQSPLTDDLIRHFALPSPRYALVTVTDNGIGFEQQYADKIFGMFQRLHGRSKYEGTGIGLTIVKKIIDNHRGFIDVQSEPGRGTTFRIMLPLGTAPSATVS
jgi:PAS domain S-box-containing protein